MQVVVLGLSSACGNVAAVRDVQVLPIRAGWVGYQREMDMECSARSGVARVWFPSGPPCRES